MSFIINESIDNQVKKINIPTILLFGNKDKITPIYLAKKIKRKIKDCELIVLNGNHFAYLYNKILTKQKQPLSRLFFYLMFCLFSELKILSPDVPTVRRDR